MWGSTTPNNDTLCDWEHAPFNNGSSDYNETYFNSVKDTVCPNGILAKEYDAASQIMGGDWRMPTKEDFDELLKGTTSEWIEDYKGTGVSGSKFTGSNGNSIFIPAAGYYGDVWSSSLSTFPSDCAWHLLFDSEDCGMYGSYRYYGRSVRGVRK